MSTRSPNAHFLGIELATDQLRASIVDEQLDLVGVECVDFDSDLPDYQTQGGIFTTPGDAYTTPIEMWVHALDLLLERLSRNFDLTKIKCIGGSAQSACIYWKASASPPFSRLNPHHSIHAQLFAGSSSPLALPNAPVAQDTSMLPQAQALEAALGGPDMTAARLGMPAHASLPAAHAMMVRETQPELWQRIGRVTLASTMLCSILMGAWAPTAESEACASGVWSQTARAWDDTVVEIIAGTNAPEEIARVKRMLGEVDTSGGARKVGNIAPYFVERYRFNADTILTPFTSDYLATYLSLSPSPTDAVLSFGPMDCLLTAAPHYLPNRLYSLFPHPVQESSEKRRYIAMLTSRNGDVPRALVRDMYTKSWSAFDRLVAIVPPGGSIGLDDKLFSFWILQGEASPIAHVKGIFRFETGIKVNEFRDLRANPRCLLESQLLSFRVRYARMRASNLFFPQNRSASVHAHQQLHGSLQQHQPSPQHSHASNLPILNPGSGLGLPFDPYSPAPLPRRIIATGAAANFPSIVNLLGDIFNAPIYIPSTQLESAHASSAKGGKFAAAHRNAPAPGHASRAALGGAFVARWVWSRDRVGGASSSVSYEDDLKRLLTRKWNITVGAARKSAGGGSGTPSPAPYLQHQRSAGLGSTVLVEEEEEDEDVMGMGMVSSPGVGGVGVYRSMNGTPGSSSTGDMYGHGTPPPLSASSTATTRARSLTASSVGTVLTGSTLGQTPSTAYTTPDLAMSSGMSGIGGLNQPLGMSSGYALGSGAGTGLGMGINLPLNGSPSNLPSLPGSTTPNAGTTSTSTSDPNATAPSGVTPLTPVSAMPTGDAEAQLGWVKVADPDLDAFMVYAAIVPEYVRLEGLLVKSIV